IEMKKVIFFLLFVMLSSALANPIVPQLFSELYFDSTGWKIEITGSWAGCQVVLMSQTDSVVVDTPISFTEQFPVLTSADIDSTFYINPNGDHLKIGTVESGWVSWVDDFIFGEGGVIAAPRPGESIAFGGGAEVSESEYYLDSSPTLGEYNDFENAKGTIQGIVTDKNGIPVDEVTVKYSNICSGSETTTAITGENGQFEFECLTAQQQISFRHEDYLYKCVPVQVWPDSTVSVTFVLTDHPQNYQNYFPLQVGNRWNYKKYINGVHSSWTTITISESIFINDKMYYLFGKDTIGYDSLKNIVIFKNQSDSLLYPLSLSPSDSIFLTPDSLWMAKLTYDQTPLTVGAGTFTENIIIEENYMGVIVAIWTIPERQTYFSRNVGLMKSYYRDRSGTTETTELYYACVNGVTYPQTSDKIVESSTPAKYAINITNYPNPFNQSTTINYSLPTNSDIELSVFDINGRCVDNLFTGKQRAGSYHFIWNGGSASSGVYLIRLRTENNVVTHKCLLVK
ncbi:MAG: T9SS type A sorting domain-containing protein, partial [Candidatus Neomarinimicrobiota bacterium]